MLLRSVRRHLRESITFSLVTTLILSSLFLPATTVSAQSAAEIHDKPCEASTMPSFDCILLAVQNSQSTGQGNLEKHSMYNAGIMAAAIGYGFAGASSKDKVDGAGVGDAGAITTVGRAMAYLYRKPPASLGDYVADLIQNNNLVRPVHAQGVGFQSLSNILPIWKTFRDISYLLLTLVFFFIGFFIIFRQKIDGHTVANISNTIPNIIIALILITFSYAIAGFMIDIMYLVIYFIVWIAGQIIKDPITVTDPIFGSGRPFQIKLEDIAITQNLFAAAMNLVTGSGPKQGDVAGLGGSAAAVSAIVYSMFSPSSVQSRLAGAVGLVAQVIAYAVFAVALFFAVVRTFFQLVKAYINFLIAVIFSPLQLLAGALSGRSTFINWIKSLAANLAPFPLVIGLIFLSMALTGFARDEKVGFHDFGQAADQTTPGAQAGGFNPPLLGMSYDTSGIGATAIQGIIGFGILMFMPEAVKMCNEFFKASGPNLGAVAEGIKTGWSGGKPIPGLGLTLPGVGAPVKSIGRTTGRAVGTGAVSAGLGALGGLGAGAIYGATRASQAVRDKKGGRLAQVAAGLGGGIVGAGVGTVGGAAGGAVVGTTAGALGGYGKVYSKTMGTIKSKQEEYELLRKYSEFFRKQQDEKKRGGAAGTSGQTPTPAGTPAATGTHDVPNT